MSRPVAIAGLTQLPPEKNDMNMAQSHAFQTTDHALAMTALHATYAPMIIELANNATMSGEPINRPVWWIDPNDAEALNIDDGDNDFRIKLIE